MADLGDQSNPFTHSTHDQNAPRFKWCRCSGCSFVERCTPSSDFFVRGAFEIGKPLLCTQCFYTPLIEAGTPFVVASRE